MYASDYPHSECPFPQSVDNILAWSSLKPDRQKKLLNDNATRFFKADHVSTRMTHLYDRRRDELSLAEVERIVI
jgi:hypothetical protein